MKILGIAGSTRKENNPVCIRWFKPYLKIPDVNMN